MAIILGFSCLQYFASFLLRRRHLIFGPCRSPTLPRAEEELKLKESSL